MLILLEIWNNDKIEITDKCFEIIESTYNIELLEDSIIRCFQYDTYVHNRCYKLNQRQYYKLINTLHRFEKMYNITYILDIISS